MALLVVLLLTLTSGPILAADDESGADESAPDIIVVMIDDHGYIPDERVLKRLPAINEMFLEGGLRLNEIYDETPLCCPARATVLTGQHTLTHGIIANGSGMPDPDWTSARALHDAGYYTFMAGKCVTGPRTNRHPRGWDHVRMSKNKNIPAFYIDSENISFEGEFFDDVVGQVAVDWLREAPLDQPVFAQITPFAPHREACRGQGKSDEVRDCDYLPVVMEQDQGSPLCADLPDFKAPDYEIAGGGRPPWSMPDWPDGWPLTRICESLLVVDRMVAELREVQAARGRPARFVFLSDNGMSWGRKSFPLKHVPTATRLPFYVSGSGIEPGDDDTLLSNIDLAPTLAAMGGAEMPRADGRSFLPLLEGEPFDGRTEILEIMPSNDKRSYEGWAGMRTPEWRYVRWEDGREELYDLVADPDELTNRAGEEPDRSAEMSTRLDFLIEDSRPGG